MLSFVVVVMGIIRFPLFKYQKEEEKRPPKNFDQNKGGKLYFLDVKLVGQVVFMDAFVCV